MNTITVFPVFDAQCPQGYVIIINRIFKQTKPYPHGSQFRVIGNTKQFRSHNAANIHHGRLGQLFYTFRNHIPGKLAQFTEINPCFPRLILFFRNSVFERQIQIKCRNVGYTGFNHLRTLHIFG